MELAIGVPVALFVVLPIYGILLFRLLLAEEPVFEFRTITGYRSKPIRIRGFSNVAAPLRNLPVFLELLGGRIALVGTTIKPISDDGVRLENAYISNVKPGIVSLWNIRKASRIAHVKQHEVEWEYVFRKRNLYDISLLLKALPAMIYRQQGIEAGPILHLMGLDIDNLTMEEAITLLHRKAETKSQCSIFFVNPDCLNKMVSDHEYYEILERSDFVFPDGIGLTLAGKLMSTPLKENINGTDMLPFLCRMAARENLPMFLLGGRPGIAHAAAESIAKTYGVTIAGHEHGFFDMENDSEIIIERINRSGTAILLVAMGAPLQEKWIDAHRGRINASILMGVGGLFDFYSGTITRAPSWMRETGLEWLYRMIQEPARLWRRYIIGNPLFMYRILHWKLFSEKHRITRLARGTVSKEKIDAAYRNRETSGAGIAAIPGLDLDDRPSLADHAVHSRHGQDSYPESLRA